ncbi:MAG TPA: hypothetical protein PLE19_15830 [Planctomycetota bacterium]|nr:hypothetical protein [Planctomycetota bacterium]HRR81325.1 hypothetical protein [Planctomycetota bacterium]HRT95593.1 hypothetical protein [Planctomycetota bacterium]
MNGVFALFVVGGILAVVGLAIFGWLAEKKRREAFAALAERLGLVFSPGRDPALPLRYGFLDALRQGDNRYAFNILRGDYQGFPVQAFDFHYETHSTDSKGHRQTHHHYLSFFLLEQRRDFPELRIYPEGFWQKFGQMLGFEDIDFESLEFSRAFCVRSKNRRFAYDVCHTRMMEYLLQHRDLSLEIEHTAIALSFNRRLKPEEIPARLDQLVQIVNLLPEYLYRS